MMDYEDGDNIKTLSCTHEFHTSCITPWLKVHVHISVTMCTYLLYACTCAYMNVWISRNLIKSKIVTCIHVREVGS